MKAEQYIAAHCWSLLTQLATALEKVDALTAERDALKARLATEPAAPTGEPPG